MLCNGLRLHCAAVGVSGCVEENGTGYSLLPFFFAGASAVSSMPRLRGGTLLLIPAASAGLAVLVGFLSLLRCGAVTGEPNLDVTWKYTQHSQTVFAAVAGQGNGHR